MRKLFYLIFLPCAALLMVACSGSDSDNGGGSSSSLSVSTPVVSSITSSSAVVSATATGSGITSRGVCYGSSANPTINNSKVTGTSANMTLTLASLQPSTTYHVRAFAQTNSEIVYSSDVTFTTTEKSTSDLDKWVAPTYADDYRDFADWANRSRWNLANVHDPSVVKADDGYYYMFCTDAGFGNPQSGHGHFHCRRSANLVDWEYLGATMTNLPAWIQTKLNEIRAQMGLGASSANLNN